MFQVIQIGLLEFRIRREFLVRKKLPNVDRMSENAADESLVEDNSVSIIIFISSFLHYFFFFFLGVVDIETVRFKSNQVGR